MYLLYLDESGSHGATRGNRAYVLAGLAVHEHDAGPLQDALTASLAHELPPEMQGVELELHAAELFRRRGHEHSRWHAIHDGRVRHHILNLALETVAASPATLFAAVGSPRDPDVERRAYETVLNCFDDFLTARGERGLAISDVGTNDAEELRMQALTDRWRHVATRAGQLDRLCDVLLFSDSRSSRLLQAADLVAWALWRRHGCSRSDHRWAKPLRFETLERLDR